MRGSRVTSLLGLFVFRLFLLAGWDRWQVGVLVLFLAIVRVGLLAFGDFVVSWWFHDGRTVARATPLSSVTLRDRKRQSVTARGGYPTGLEQRGNWRCPARNRGLFGRSWRKRRTRMPVDWLKSNSRCPDMAGFDARSVRRWQLACVANQCRRSCSENSLCASRRIERRGREVGGFERGDELTRAWEDQVNFNARSDVARCS